LFADIADFTHISEKLDPEGATRLINCCLEEMTNEIVKYGGRFNKYIGDGLMSVFSHSSTQRQNARNAAMAALDMQENIASLEFGPNIPLISLHVGIACGIVLAIEVGGQQREFTVIGSAVNRASQLEDISAPGQTLVSDEVYQLIASDFTLRPVSHPIPQSPGKTMTVYELVK
jgi:class 3 adenylate cyclase